MLGRSYGKNALLALTLTLVVALYFPAAFAGGYGNANQYSSSSSHPSAQVISVANQFESSPSINITVLDAVTGQPIENATIILWDLSTLEQPKPGAGIYFTNESGECSIFGDYLRSERPYWLYAYRGDFEARKVDYAPIKVEVSLERAESLNLTLRLMPGALIELKGIPYIVQSSNPEERYMTIKVIEKGEPINSPFIREYGNSPDAFMLGLSRKMIIVPANVPFVLEVKLWYFSREMGPIGVGSKVFYIDNSSLPLVMSQGSFLSSIRISAYSLKESLKDVETAFLSTSKRVDDAQAIGFTVFDERRSLTGVNQKIIEAGALLRSAKTDEDFEGVWLTLREALGEVNYISIVVQNKYLIGKTNAVYLSAVIAVFSVVLAFFFFENERKKVISSIVIYALSIVALYFIHPGAHVIIDENLQLFLESMGISFAAVLAVVFGIPRVWKERKVEGEVSWRAALTIIFSMGKRQIKRKKLRGFFTVFSICILILAFTSLTSFGTAFGVVSEAVNATPPSEGILVKRMINGSSDFFSPLGYGDLIAISKIMPLTNVAQRFKNLPRGDPLARLINPDTRDYHFIYGVVAVSPKNETYYTRLNEVVEGGYLSDEGSDETLISSGVAEKLGLKVNDKVILEVSGTIVSETLTVKGLINDEEYGGLIDVDGSYFGPSRLLEDGSARRCNSTEIIIINLKTAEKIQESIDDLYGENAPQFVLPAEIVFQPATAGNVEAGIKRLVSTFSYDVFVSSNNVITYYHIGSYIEFKGAAELLIPIVMVVLNVSMVMITSAYEREKEIRVLSTVGLNPTHIGLTFVAEATVIGMVGGSLGYLAGLGFYRIMILFGQDLMVREKLEWWWSALGFALAILISVLSAMRPAAMAVSAYTPSKVKRVKKTEEEAKKRKEELFRVYQAREISMPVKVLVSEKVFFVNYFLDRLDELRSGYMERIDRVEDIPEVENVRGELIKVIKFVYAFGPPERRRGTKNILRMIKSPSEDYYRVRLVSEPLSPGMPETVVERTVDFVHEILMAWARDKSRIIGV